MFSNAPKDRTNVAMPQKRRIDAVKVLGVVLVTILAYSLLYWRTDLDRAILTSGRTHDDISDIVAGYLPDDFEGAIEALGNFGFEERRSAVGEVFRRRTLPEKGETNRGEISVISYYNSILKKTDGEWFRLFEREIPKPILPGVSVAVYLIETRKGTRKIYARSFEPFYLP